MSEELGQVGQAMPEMGQTDEVSAELDVLAAAEAILAASVPEPLAAPATPTTSAAPACSPFALTEDKVFSEPPPLPQYVQEKLGQGISPEHQKINALFQSAPDLATAQSFVQEKLAQGVNALHQQVVTDFIATDHPVVVSIPLPALPGTPASPFRRCPCIGVLPGRACPRCSNTHWVRLCPKCEGEGVIHINVRRGAVDRVDKCGFCMGVGSVRAGMDEVRAAEEAAREAMAQAAAGVSQSEAVADTDSAPVVYRRHAKLPGMGNGSNRTTQSAKSTKSTKPAKSHAKAR